MEEAVRLGFNLCMCPPTGGNNGAMKAPAGAEMVHVRDLSEALEKALS
jgi:hypothetical protein